MNSTERGDRGWKQAQKQGNFMDDSIGPQTNNIWLLTNLGPKNKPRFLTIGPRNFWVRLLSLQQVWVNFKHIV
jgi:hypothetical protein